MIGTFSADGGDGIDTFRFNENGAPETGITLSLLLQGQAQASGNGSWTQARAERDSRDGRRPNEASRVTLAYRVTGPVGAH